METTVYQSNIRKKYMSLDLLISSILNDNILYSLLENACLKTILENDKDLVWAAGLFPLSSAALIYREEISLILVVCG